MIVGPVQILIIYSFIYFFKMKNTILILKFHGLGIFHREGLISLVVRSWCKGSFFPCCSPHYKQNEVRRYLVVRLLCQNKLKRNQSWCICVCVCVCVCVFKKCSWGLTCPTSHTLINRIRITISAWLVLWPMAFELLLAQTTVPSNFHRYQFCTCPLFTVRSVLSNDIVLLDKTQLASQLFHS